METTKGAIYARDPKDNQLKRIPLLGMVNYDDGPIQERMAKVEDLAGDREYNQDLPNGMGYIILDKTKTFAEQVISPNTIYEIRYDFDLGGQTVTIPENCILKFKGGSLSNGIIKGKLLNSYLKPEWFFNNPKSDYSEAFQNCLNLGTRVLLSNNTYHLYKQVVINVYNIIQGVGIQKSIIVSHIDNDYLFLHNVTKSDSKIPNSTPYSIAVIKDLTVQYGRDDYIKDEDIIYNKNCNFIYSLGYIELNNIKVCYFDKVLLKPIYVDFTYLKNLYIDDRSRLSNPLINFKKDYNIALLSNGDNTTAINLTNAQIYLRNVNNAIFINQIQCGFIIDYSKIYVTCSHNEDTDKYPIILKGQSSLKLSNSLTHRGNNSYIYCEDDWGSYDIIIEETKFAFHNSKQEQINTNLNSIINLKGRVNLALRNTMYQIPAETISYLYGIPVNIKNNIEFIYGNSIDKEFNIKYNLINKNVYLNENVKSGNIDDLSNFSKTTYTYKFYILLDDDRKILFNKIFNKTIEKTDIHKTTIITYDLYFKSKVIIVRTNPLGEIKHIIVPFNNTVIQLVDDGLKIKGIGNWLEGFDLSLYNIFDNINYLNQYNSCTIIGDIDSVETLKGSWNTNDKIYNIKGKHWILYNNKWILINNSVA